MLIYLASPYTNLDEKIMEKKYQEISQIAAKMCNEGHVIFSPISYGHNLSNFYKLPLTWDFWKNFCFTFLEKCDKLIVCKMEGWEKSIGVNEEIKFAQEHDIPIEYLDPL